MNTSCLLAIEIGAPSLAGFLTILFGLSRRYSSITAVIAGLVSTVCSLLIMSFAFKVKTPIIIAPPITGGSKVISFIIDPTSAILGVIVALVGTLILYFSVGYISPLNKEHPIVKGYAWFYGMMLIFMASMLGFVYSYSLLSMFLFYELTGVCSWSLIGFYHERKESIYGAEKALFITHLGGLFFMAAIAIEFLYTGVTTLDGIAKIPAALKPFFIAFIAIACWTKSAQLPFWTWLPDAMVAPTPVSAYLHAAAMVKVGPILMLRVVQFMGASGAYVGLALAIMAVATMVFGLLMYVPQIDMKRLLAYSTITQLSYMFLALAFASLGIANGIRGALFHIWNHAYAKALFFLTAGALAYTTGSKNMTDYSGLIHKSKTIAVSFAIAAFAISGVPPLNCFYSKYLIFTSGFEAGNPWAIALTLIAIGESVCCFIIFLHWFTRCVLNKPSKLVKEAQNPTFSMKLTLLILVALTIVSAYILYPVLSSIGFAGGV